MKNLFVIGLLFLPLLCLAQNTESNDDSQLVFTLCEVPPSITISKETYISLLTKKLDSLDFKAKVSEAYLKLIIKTNGDIKEINFIGTVPTEGEKIRTAISSLNFWKSGTQNGRDINAYITMVFEKRKKKISVDLYQSTLKKKNIW